MGDVNNEAHSFNKYENHVYTYFSVQTTCDLNNLKMDNALIVRKFYIKVVEKTFYNVISKI